MDPRDAVTAYRTCPLCEATCGLELTLEDGADQLASAATREDVFSHGFICPKGVRAEGRCTRTRTASARR